MSRKIQEIRNGTKRGPVSSYVTASNVASLNPFVLWDHFHLPQADGTAGFGFHGHSGVATISYPQIGDIEHEDTGGHKGTLYAGGVQIMAAGSGVLHKETVYPDNKVADAFQLWTALPAEQQEMGSVVYSTAQQQSLPIHYNQNGAATKVIAGRYNGLISPINAPVDMTYLHINLPDNAVWRYEVKPEQTTVFIYVRSGQVATGDTEISAGELGIFESSDLPIEIKSLDKKAEFLIVSGSPLDQEIISNGASVHSNTENLIAGAQHIRRLHNQMANA